MGSIYDLMVKSDKFKAIMDAIKIANMADVLSSDGPYTVFAPTDEAVAQVPKSQFSEILNEKSKLLKIIKYHMVSGKIDSENILQMLRFNDTIELKSLEGSPLTIGTSGVLKKHIRVNDAVVIAADVYAKNGVIHLVDRVLKPVNL